MASGTPENGRRAQRSHKPFLIDPAVEGTRPPGVDSAWWAQLLGLLQLLLPRRFRGLPPLFYPASLTGIACGVMFLIILARLAFGVEAWPGADSYGDELSELGPVADALAYALAALVLALGVVQGVGVLLRKLWGLIAAYAWLSLLAVLPWALCCLQGEFSTDPTDPLFALLWSALAVCWLIYYHNRRLWFTVAPRP